MKIWNTKVKTGNEQNVAFFIIICRIFQYATNEQNQMHKLSKHITNYVMLKTKTDILTKPK